MLRDGSRTHPCGAVGPEALGWRVSSARSYPGAPRWAVRDIRRSVPRQAERGLAMPIYEFVCLDCKKEFDVVKSVGEYDPKRIECPKCHSKKVERHWSRVFVETTRKS